MAVEYTDVDRLILERWTDVVGLIEAQRDVQDRMQDVILLVRDRLIRWARPLGFEIDAEPKDAEYWAWRPAWADRRRGHRLRLVLGGFCPRGYRKQEIERPYLSVYTGTLEEFRLKDAERIAFGQALRAALGEQARDWEAHDVDDANEPLAKYLPGYDDAERAKLLLNADTLFDFCTEHFPKVFQLADLIDAELQRLGR